MKLKAVLDGCPELWALTGHVRAFGTMLTQLQGDRLPQWIKAVRADGLPNLHIFVNGLEGGLAAVTAGLTLPWSSGVVEGNVNRIILWNPSCQVPPRILPLEYVLAGRAEARETRCCGHGDLWFQAVLPGRD